MSVLVMRTIPAEEAFVIHTTNPLTNELDQVYAEACDGLGEALVGDFAGQGLAFSYSKTNSSCEVLAYPNKP